MTKFSIIVDYRLHVKEITADFCINKDKPEIECEGKCYLEKQLLEINPTEENQPLNDKLVSQSEIIVYAILNEHILDEIEIGFTKENSARFLYLSPALDECFRLPPYTPPKYINA